MAHIYFTTVHIKLYRGDYVSARLWLPKLDKWSRPLSNFSYDYWDPSKRSDLKAGVYLAQPDHVREAPFPEQLHQQYQLDMSGTVQEKSKRTIM